MQKKELLYLDPKLKYEFAKSKDGANHICRFETVRGIIYTVIFKPSSYIFGEQQPYASLLFEFSILAKFSGPESYVRDDLIAPTVVAIFLDFYNSHDENISFYICDSSDGKQHVRKRKSDMWFDEYNRGAFIKIDSDIKDAEGTKYPVAFIMRSENKYRKELINAFSELIAEYNDGK